MPVGIAKDGHWVLAPDDPEALRLAPGHVPEVDTDAASVIVPTSATDRTLVVHEAGQPPRTLGEVDVVFPLLHGPFGEDGTIQGLLDLADVRYVGSGVTASAVMMDKHVMKVLLASAGLPVGPYTVITDKEWRRDKAAAMDAVHALSWPVFVKPARAGSSMGITKVSDPDGAGGRDRGGPRARPQGGRRGGGLRARDRVRGARGARHRRHPHQRARRVHRRAEPRVLRLRGEVPRRGRRAARDAGRRAGGGGRRGSGRWRRGRSTSAGCEGLARVDFFLTETGDVLVNEVNTMPGFTPHSMYPRMWAATGLSYPELIDELIALALERRTGLR